MRIETDVGLMVDEQAAHIKVAARTSSNPGRGERGPDLDLGPQEPANRATPDPG
jgi:hypothetical protein